MTDELLPCPFCGATAEHYHRKNSPSGFFQNDVDYWVSCTGEQCCAQVGYYDSAASAIAAWNTRAPSGWQDIATAPKDGTAVDLWCINHLHYAKRGERKCNVTWGTVTDWMNREREDWRHGHGEDLQPTHWMPLPEPPK